MAGKKKERNKGDDANLEMTPMIDVVFQLLIFFIVTLKPQDLLSSLEALRPAPDSAPKPQVNEPTTIQINHQNGFFYGTGDNVKFGNEQKLRGYVHQVARINPDAMVLIKCTDRSKHGRLVRALDILASEGLHSVSVFSLDQDPDVPSR